MKKFLIALMIILAFGAAYSCGGGGGGGGGGTGYLGGTWTGTWVSTVGPWTGVIYVQLNQDGVVITGSGYITDEGIKYTGSGTGTVTNANGPGKITFGMALSGVGVVSTFTGNYTATTIVGTYADSEGDRGTFSLVKQ